jgi:hypothetical protein
MITTNEAEQSNLPVGGQIAIKRQSGSGTDRGNAEAILGLCDECQPGGTIGSRVAWPVVFREHAANDILSISMLKA